MVHTCPFFHFAQALQQVLATSVPEIMKPLLKFQLRLDNSDLFMTQQVFLKSLHGTK